MNASTTWHPGCERDALTDRQAVEFTVDDTPGFVMFHRDQLGAYANRCPHLGIELNWMPGRFLDADGDFIQCATHGALFTPDRGHCIAGPCQGDALSPLEVRESRGQILVRVPD